jgi:hypothetical protein
MKLLVFWIIVLCFACVWAGFGWLEFIAFANGSFVTLCAAAFVAILEE